MENKHEECEKALHIGFGVAKLVLKAAAVAAAFCLVKEVHKAVSDTGLRAHET